jgi:hypothetical protein
MIVTRKQKIAVESFGLVALYLLITVLITQFLASSYSNVANTITGTFVALGVSAALDLLLLLFFLALSKSKYAGAHLAALSLGTILSLVLFISFLAYAFSQSASYNGNNCYNQNVLLCEINYNTTKFN